MRAFIEIVLSCFLRDMKRFITPILTVTVVMLIGLSLIKAYIIDISGGKWLLDNKPGFFSSTQNLVLGILVLLVVLVLHLSKTQCST